MKLYEIPVAYREWEQKVDAAGGELTPELEAELSDIADTLTSKTDSICALVRESDRHAEAYRKEAEAFTKKARAAEARAERLKEYLRLIMGQLGADSFRGERFTIRLAKASRPSIRWDDIAPPPPEFSRVRVELDLERAYHEWQVGTLPDGFTVKHTEYVAIR